MSGLSSSSSSASSAVRAPVYQEPMVIVRPEVHEGELAHDAIYWRRLPTRREREVVLGHIERLTEETQTEAKQPWIRRIRS